MNVFNVAVMFRKRIQQMEQQLSSLTAAIMNSDLNLHKPSDHGEGFNPLNAL